MARIQGKYRCCECGKIFDEKDVLTIEEDRGEFWGMPCTETCYYSPCCTGDFEEIYGDELIDE